MALYGPIDQGLRPRLASRAIEHLRGLSLRSCLGRHTGEIRRSLNSGLRACASSCSMVIFVILSFVAEMLFVARAPLWRLDPLFAGILPPTLAVDGCCWRSARDPCSHRRRAWRAGAAARGQAVAGLLDDATINHFNPEERRRQPDVRIAPARRAAAPPRPDQNRAWVTQWSEVRRRHLAAGAAERACAGAGLAQPPRLPPLPFLPPW